MLPYVYYSLSWGMNPPNEKRKNLQHLLDYKVRRLFDEERQNK